MKDLIQGVEHLLIESAGGDSKMALNQIRAYVASKLRGSPAGEAISSASATRLLARAEFKAELPGGMELWMWINANKENPKLHGAWRLVDSSDSSSEKKRAWTSWQTGSIRRKGDPIVAKIRASGKWK